MSHALSPDLAVSAGLTELRFPETKEEADLVEDALAQELANLSMEEHEKALFDVHGINLVRNEEPEVVGRELQNMREELDKIKEKKAYDLAKAMNPDFVESLYISFLRSEFFNPKLGAEKLVQHFDMKLRLFGDGEIMGRKIYQSDLSGKDLEYLHCGFMQLSPLRDSSGRGVCFMSQMYGKDDRDCMLRVIMYIGMKSLCEDLQQTGLVYVFYNYENLAADLEYMKPVYRVEKSLPVRLLGGHYCYTDEKLRPFVAGLQAFIPKFDRHRFRQHLGTPEEIDFKLQTFGIPTHTCPFHPDGTTDNKWHMEWITAEKLFEENEKRALQETGKEIHEEEKDGPITVERFDVLLGKSTMAREHTGNRRSLHLCEMFYDKYEMANKYQKTDLAERIVNVIKESGGRFLKEEDDGWLEVEDIVARQKIAHSFRYLRHRNKSNAAKQTKAVPTTTTKPRRVSYKAKTEVGSDDSSSDSEYQVITFKRVTPPSSPFEPDHTDMTSLPKMQKI